MRARKPIPLCLNPTPNLADGSSDCGDIINNPISLSPSPYGPASFMGAPTKLVPYLPANWWVFSQPLLEQMYTVLDFTAFGGQGGIHFTPQTAPPTPPPSPSPSPPPSPPPSQSFYTVVS